jgi:ribosomal 30S subunit maturation factor RimM
MKQFVQIEQRERRRRLIARLQERNQKLQEEIAWNEQIIKELAENPEQEEEEEYYEDSVEDAESFGDIASLEIIDPPLQ